MKRLLKSFILLLTCIVSYTGYAQVKKVEAIGITVRDMPSAVKFYSEVLGFKKVSDHEESGEVFEKLEGIFGLHMRVVRMQLGDEFIELIDYLTAGGRAIPETMRSNDLAFQHIAIVVSDMDKAYAHLRAYNVEHISTAPQTLPASIAPASGVKAFYFHDQDNHSLELIYFPKGKGQPKWQQHNGKIFLGIDHTAIGISGTENSLHFYQDLLGIDRKGESWNKGIEQEHLNNVQGASLHITGLRSASGPGIEFLQYLQPLSGKPYPSDTRADDIWYWQTTLVVDDAQSVYNKLDAAGYKFISDGIIDLGNSKHSKAFIVKDPDGHAMLIKE